MTQESRLNRFIIRVSKNDAAFIYFQFEANEGLCFFSTMAESLSQPYRDIQVLSPLSVSNEINHLLDYLGQEIDIQFIEKEVVQDSASLVSSNVKGQ